jgi:thiol-disulfide isomerase/thioredoxin
LLCICASACDEPAADSGTARAVGRVDAIRANAKKSQLADLCDVAPEPAKDFTWPELDHATAAQTGSQYRWVNVWATWCKPCVEELPLLARTFAGWRQKKHPIALTLVSVDADAAAPEQFLAAHRDWTDVPPNVALKDPSAANSWLASTGLASGSAIPVHLILDAHDKLLCARSGGISAQDLERFQHALFP